MREWGPERLGLISQAHTAPKQWEVHPSLGCSDSRTHVLGRGKSPSLIVKGEGCTSPRNRVSEGRGRERGPWAREAAFTNGSTLLAQAEPGWPDFTFRQTGVTVRLRYSHFHPERKCETQGFQVTHRLDANAVRGRLALGKGMPRKVGSLLEEF